MPTRFLFALALAVFTLIGLATRVIGLSRSFWTDEVWVANSVVSSSLQQLFYPDSWLQTTAPLFLLLARATSLIFGPSEAALRLVPCLMGILAALGFLILAHRLLDRGPALLASTLFLFTPMAIIYSRMFKQYSAELAFAVFILLATQNYLQARTHKAFFILLGLCLSGFTIGYGLAFLLPAILVALILPLLDAKSSLGTKRCALLHATLLALLSASTLFAEYLFFVLPNSADSLNAFMFRHLDSTTESVPRFFLDHFYTSFQRSLPFLPPRLALSNPRHALLLAILALLLGSGLVQGIRRNSKALPFRLFAYSTVLFSILSARLAIYPALSTTILYSLPLTAFLLADGLHCFWLLVIRRLPFPNNRRIATASFLLLSIALVLSFQNPPAGPGEQTFEDFRSAVEYLKIHSTTSDSLFVHGSAAEAHRFYSGILNWKLAQTYVADTGWSCCARNRDNRYSNPNGFLSDLTIKLPFPLHGRLWTLYTDRELFYFYYGFDERPLMRQFLNSKGCRESDRQTFHQVGVAAWDCP